MKQRKMSLSEEEGEVFYEASDVAENAAGAANEEAGAAAERQRQSKHPRPLTRSPAKRFQSPARSDITTASSNASSSRSRKRHSLQLSTTVPDVPAIPAHLLATGKRATLLQRRTTTTDLVASEESWKPPSSPLSLSLQRPSTSDGQSPRLTPLRSPSLPTSRKPQHHGAIKTSLPSPQPSDYFTRRKSFSATSRQVNEYTLAQLEKGLHQGTIEDMERVRRNKNDDLFLELANDSADNAGIRPPSRSERASSRLSFAEKRRSLPPRERGPPSSGDNRPKTSGSAYANRPSTRLDTAPSELQRHTERFRDSPSRAGYRQDDAVSLSALSSSGRRQRYSSLQERSTMSPSRLVDTTISPDLPHYGRRRPSFGTTASQAQKSRPSQLSGQQQDSFSESPGGSSDPKQSLPDSASVESDTADTVWDELDDLKTRIKKLELTGKAPSTSGAAISGESSERPHTATTAPTTIDSSPKHDKPAKKAPPEDEAIEIVATNTVGGPSVANIHPNLHSALAKAKPLLTYSLYRSLEATAADALQLVAMTGSAGPQGTTFSAASIINGVTVSDRHVRRKADTMCRNLTDLCLALCEGKHDPPSATASPVMVSPAATSSPSLRYPRNSLGPNDDLNRTTSRPMSRLDARRSSILGTSRLGASPARTEDASASEQETTPSNNGRSSDLRGFHRSASRLQRIRAQHSASNDASRQNEDDEPTIRPPSRAMTDYVSRAKPRGPREYSTPQRSPSLRDALTSRRASAVAQEGGQQLSRVASMGSDASVRRRFLDPSTPPVLEEEREVEGEEYSPAAATQQSQARRVMSLGRRKGVGEGLGRTSGLMGRRGVVVE